VAFLAVNWAVCSAKKWVMKEHSCNPMLSADPQNFWYYRLLCRHRISTKLSYGFMVAGARLKVAPSILEGVFRIFHWRNPSGRTMALGSTQPVTEMSTTNISWE
jgi:hypothetical protein